MSQHAYLIMAHTQNAVLKQLLQQLDDQRNDIYLHMDAKCQHDGSAYFAVIERARLILVPRLNVRWGSYSLVDCEVNLLRAATHNQRYDYYHLLSGDSLALQSQDEIHRFFAAHAGQEFIQFQAAKPAEETLQRIRYFYPATPFNKAKLVRGIKAVGLKLQRAVGVNRLNNVDFIPQKGGQWCSITDDLARYVLSQEPWFAQRFRHTYAPDEFFIQTIVENSNFKKSVFDQNYSDSCQSCQRYIKWAADHFGPIPMTLADYDTLLSCKCLFARKFSDEETELLAKIIRHTG